MILSMTKHDLVLDEYKSHIAQYLTDFLAQKKKSFAKISLDDDVFNTIKNFALRGKMARAHLLILTYQAFGQKIDKKSLENWLLPLASALELIQAGLLIHDDIIDQDQQRRGQDSIWQYYTLQKQTGDQHYGKSQAICLGDLCFFLANQLVNEGVVNLQSTSNSKKTAALDAVSIKIQELINREISQVIMAEMLDVQLAAEDKVPSLQQITEMNLYKTARYSFSLPFMLAAYVARQSQTSIEQVSKIGEKLGLIFQIQDDYLGIFGDEKITGKPILSDVREGKKTIFYYYLVKSKKLNAHDKKLLDRCFGATSINKKDGVAMQAMFQVHALNQVTSLLNQLKQEAIKEIEQLENQDLQIFLTKLLNTLQHRQK